MTNVCCCACLNIIKQKLGNNHADIWQYLCGISDDAGGIIPMNGSDIPVLRDLEMMRFIATHEIKDMILIKILGKTKDCMNQSLFCPEGNHV